MFLRFVRYYITGVLLLNNLHACNKPHRSTKICILIIIKRCCRWQCKAWRERFTPYQSEDLYRFELFCFTSKGPQPIA